MPSTHVVHTLNIKAGQKIFHPQNCLYSNQIEHLAPAADGSGRCAFVRVAGRGQPAVYARDQLMAVRFFPKAWAPAFAQDQISSDTLEQLLSSHLNALRESKLALTGRKNEAFRWVHGDADGIAGIVADDYGDVVVVQSGSHFGDFLLPFVLPALLSITDKAVFERSSGQVRTLEKLPERTRWIREPDTAKSKSAETVLTTLSGLQLRFRPQRCQKTGLFLDQRENLDLFRTHTAALGAASMLDLCSYAGAWSCAGAQAGMTQFTLVDQDKDALEMARTNIAANIRAASEHNINALHGDLFEVLSKLVKDKIRCDAVVADPPAFTKSAKHIPEAKRAYQRLTKLASQLVASGGLYVACSCSRHIGEDDFYELVSGSLEADDWIYLGRGRQSPDHTVLAADKQSLYLKVLFFVRRGTLAQTASFSASGSGAGSANGGGDSQAEGGRK